MFRLQPQVRVGINLAPSSWEKESSMEGIVGGGGLPGVKNCV